ncbi:DUF2971 domain-containing protein [Flavobacterium sp.]|uniref:DUF2971 domain-containing protein n=1 Tax=Flavobacterium sp. TaxID=239 RepID=UPI0038FCECF8
MSKQFSYNNFIYEKESSSEKGGVKIINAIPYPEKLHKFYPINSFSVDALVNGYFYASHTFELNDYLDSSPFLWHALKPLDFEFYKEFLGKDVPRDELIKFYEADASNVNLCKGYISKYWEIISNIFGIISLTANENSLLMWPHYTQEKGFQITFNASELEVSINDKIGQGQCFGVFPMNYTEFLNPIDISEFDSMHIPFFYATNVKSDKWKYEDEWRFLIGKPMMGVPNSKMGLNTEMDFITSPKNRYTFYDNRLVDHITLGINFFTAQDFNLEWLNEKHFKVSPKNSITNWNYKSYKKLLFYIHENLKDKIYHSGTKYELDKKNNHFLIRTKERLEIKKVGWDTYIFTRTEDIIKIF